jgi:hypothetical protein
MGTRALSLGVKRQKCLTDHSPPSSAEVKGELAVTPRQLFSWPQTSMENINCEVVTERDFIEEGKLLF